MQEVRYEYLMPKEANEILAKTPVLFQPLGTIEWHGWQNILGLDSLKAHELCIRAARQAGGIVAPPLYGGIGGLEVEEHTYIIDEKEDYSPLLRPWLERLCHEARRHEFKAIIILTGHYGAGQQICVRETASRMTQLLGIPVLGLPEYFLALDEGYTGDHAAWGETSLMMELFPDKVDLSRLNREDGFKGIGGRDPKESTREDGKRLCDTIVKRLVTLGTNMPNWSRNRIELFGRSEAAIVMRQRELAGETFGMKNNIWAGWRHIEKGAFAAYGQLLVEEKFEEIIELTKEF